MLLEIGKTETEAETPILWPPDVRILWSHDVKRQLIGKNPDAGKDWRQEAKGMAEDEKVRWHHQLNRRDWASSGSWWWTRKPGVLQAMGSKRVEHDWVTELKWTDAI